MRNFNLKDHTLAWMGRRGQFRAGSRGTFWPSEAAVLANVNGQEEVLGKCLRASYYRLTGTPESNPITAKSQVIFMLGKSVEETVIELWKQSGIWDNNSVRFEDRSHNISGEFDCIVKDPATGRKFGVEVKSFWGFLQEKTILGRNEGRGANRRWVYGKPKDENLMQAAIYADQTRGQLDGFKLFYVSRDNCEMAEFNITVDDNGTIYIHDPKSGINAPDPRFTIHDVYRRYDLLADYLNRGEMPPRDFTWKPDNDAVQILYDNGKISKTAYEGHMEKGDPYTDWHCDYCSYKDHCHEVSTNATDN